MPWLREASPLACVLALSVLTFARGYLIGSPVTRTTIGRMTPFKNTLAHQWQTGQQQRLGGGHAFQGPETGMGPSRKSAKFLPRCMAGAAQQVVGATSWGPEPGRTWAAEAVLAASLRQADASVGLEQRGRSQVQGRGSRSSREDARSWQTPDDEGGVRVEDGRERSTTKLLASNLLRIVRVTAKDGDGTRIIEGILTEVQEGTASCPMSGAGRSQQAFFSLRNAEGAHVTMAVADALEIQVCTVEGSADKATRAHLETVSADRCGTPTLPPTLLDDDVQLTMLRGLSASLGRKVLVQNLRHVMVGLAGFRAPWTDLLSSDAVEAGGTHAAGRHPEVTRTARGHPLRGWMVKVLPVQRSYQEGQSGGEQWVGVEEVLPMSEYDLEAYATYRHETLPSSEYDLQRHDPALQSRYRKSDNVDPHLVGGGGAMGADTGVGAPMRRLRDAYAGSSQYSAADLALVG